MKALFAILITISLSIGVYIVSALIYFDLTWVLVGITSVWAGIDSKRIGLSRYKLRISCGPVAVFCLCYLFWIIIFPFYLWERFKIKQGTAHLKDKGLSDLSLHPANRPYSKFSKCVGKVAEWLLIGLVTLKIGILGFFIEESWRGPHVWGNYRRELEAKGESFNWDAMIPPLVPDSQNFFNAPMMSEWFVQPSQGINITDDISKRLVYPNSSAEAVMAEIIFVNSGTYPAPSKNDILLNFDDPRSREQAKKIIQNVIGPCAFGSQGLTLLTQPLNISQIKPPRIFLEAKQKPDAKDLIKFFSNGLQIFRPDGTNSWQILTSFCLATDYLNWSDQFSGDLNLMREALKRPYARMEGDYSFPPTIPIPNYISLRAVSETLVQRAQCYLLLDQPDKALQEVTLLNDLRHITEGAPTGKPMSLVSAMLNVAVAGVYAETIADGFRLHAWKEPQLVSLQKQLEQLDLAPHLKESFHEEAVSSLRMAENVMRQFVVRRDPSATLWQKIRNLRPPNIVRGFFYFSTLNTVKIDQLCFDSIDLSQEDISMEKVAEFNRQEEALAHIHHWQIYKLFAEIAVPNFTKAIQTFAFNQTKINEAQVVCALERYRLAHGNYPKGLGDLVPDYIGHLPHDIIGGQPLKYRQTSNGGYLLYSVGWNQVDDGGQFSPSFDQGDWVWQ